MDADTKQALDDLKELVATLKKKEDADSQAKDELIKDLQAKQAKFESKRKGNFVGDEDDTDELIRKNQGSKSMMINNLVQSKSMDEKIVMLQEANDNILTVAQLLNCDPRDTKIYHDTLKTNSFLTKDLDTATSGQGSDWVPVGYSSRLFDRVRLELMVAKLHEEMYMPTALYKPPIVTTDSVGYLIAENTGDDDFVTAAKLIKATQPGTSNFTLTAKKIAGRVVFSEEITEDSIVPILPFITGNIVLALSQAQEQATINGDITDSTHMDSDSNQSYDARKSWDGYRKMGSLAGTGYSLATLTGENLSSLRTKMGRYGVRPENLAFVTSISGYNQLMNLKDAGNNNLVITLEKYGGLVTILSGELGRVYGIPIIVSEYVRQDLNATGIYDATTTTKTEIILVNKKCMIYGDRRTMKVKVAEQIQTDQTILVATMRKAFSAVYPPASNTIVSCGYNITS
jgi:HK97 family phage major capsid protein